MIDNNKPTILLSRCIEGEKCRYDGTMAKNKFIEKLKPYVNIITVCPESDIGLPTPRETLRLIKDNEDIKLVFSKSGEEKTREIIEFTEKFLREIEEVNIHGVIFKSKSPSCGVKDVKIYTGIGKASAIIKNASGIFSEKCINKFNCIPIEDDGRLTLDNLEKYQNKKVPFSVPLTIIKSWAIRFNNEYLLNQSIFESFPSELIGATDSGKGI